MKKRVFVVQDDGTKDLVSAMDYGDIVVLNTRSLPLFRDPSEQLAKLRQDLAHYKFCAGDYIVPIGDPVLIGATIHYAALTSGGIVNCLKWDARHKRYFEVKIKL